MNRTLIDHATPPARPPTMERPPRLTRQQAVIVALIAILLGTWAFIDAKEIRTDIDATTATSVIRTQYPLGFAFGPPQVRTSAFERRLRAIGAAWRPRWQHLNTTSYGPFGLGVARACSSAPPSYTLASVDAEFMAGLTDAEVVALARVMEVGTPAEQDGAISAAIERMGSRVSPAQGSSNRDGATP